MWGMEAVRKTEPAPGLVRFMLGCGAAMLATAIESRAAISVSDPTSSFTQMVGFSAADPGYTAGTNYLSDIGGDQGTGQGADDFVGGLYMQSDSTTLMFRFYFNQYRSQGFSGNVRLGVDANGDGAVDIYFGVKDSGSGSGVVFQDPTGTSPPANTTPNNSALGNVYGSVALSSANYNYVASSVQYGSATYPDAELTFAMPFATLQSNLSTLGIAIDTSTSLRFVAFTATNTNTVTQDVLGLGAIKTYGDTAYTSGLFTDYYSADGSRRQVPEAATVAQTAVLMALPGYFWIRRRIRTPGSRESVPVPAGAIANSPES
jgi:hypothetical protein